MRVSSEESTDLDLLFTQVQETSHKQTNKQPQCFYTFHQKIQVWRLWAHQDNPSTVSEPPRYARRPYSCKKRDDASTADHKMLNENESRLKHRHAVVLQDLLSYGIQCDSMKKKKCAVNFVVRFSAGKKVLFIQTFLWNFLANVKTCVGITTSQLHTNQ